MLPGEILEPKREDVDYKLVPMTNKFRDKVNREGKMKVIYALAVNEVEFVDGSRFKDKQTSEAISALLKKCNNE